MSAAGATGYIPFAISAALVYCGVGLLINVPTTMIIEALPAIVARHPDVVFIVLGATHPHVLKDPPPAIGVSHLGRPAVTIAVEPWTKVVHYGSLQGELSKAIVERFRAAQIEFPSPSQPVPVR